MSGAAARRARVLRLRAIEHRIATVGLVAADAAHGAVARINERVTQLRDGIAVPHSACRGHDLQSLCELAQRLDRAQRGLQPSLEETRAMRDVRNAERLAAHVAEERMARVHVAAMQREAMAKELQAASSQPPRLARRKERP